MADPKASYRSISAEYTFLTPVLNGKEKTALREAITAIPASVKGITNATNIFETGYTWRVHVTHVAPSASAAQVKTMIANVVLGRSHTGDEEEYLDKLILHKVLDISEEVLNG